MINKNLADLKEPAKSRIIERINTWNKGNPSLQIRVSETIRSKEQQAIYVKTGKSQTMNSNHLGGLAVDIYWLVPNDIYLAKYPNGEQHRKNLCGLANTFGLVNGFYDLNWGFDKPHFQIRECQKPIGKSLGYDKAKLYKSENTNNIKKDNLVMIKLR